MTPEIDKEFGSLTIGTWFRIDSNGFTFEKTSDREARIVVGNAKLLSIPSRFGLLKPVRVVSRKPQRIGDAVWMEMKRRFRNKRSVRT